MDKLNGIFGKVDNTEQRYEKALTDKEEFLLVLQLELAEKKNEITELHKMKILGDISEETYDKQNEKFLALQDKFNEAQHEITLIQQYKRADVTTLLEELKATQKEHQATHNQEIRQMQVELLEAKAEYLNKMKEMNERYRKTVEPHDKIQMLERKLDLKQHVYTSGSHESLGTISVGEAKYVSLRVDAPELFEALQYGKIDQQLQKNIADIKAEVKLKG